MNRVWSRLGLYSFIHQKYIWLETLFGPNIQISATVYNTHTNAWTIRVQSRLKLFKLCSEYLWKCNCCSHASAVYCKMGWMEYAVFRSKAISKLSTRETGTTLLSRAGLNYIHVNRKQIVVSYVRASELCSRPIALLLYTTQFLAHENCEFIERELQINLINGNDWVTWEKIRVVSLDLSIIPTFPDQIIRIFNSMNVY